MSLPFYVTWLPTPSIREVVPLFTVPVCVAPVRPFGRWMPKVWVELTARIWIDPVPLRASRRTVALPFPIFTRTLRPDQFQLREATLARLAAFDGLGICDRCGEQRHPVAMQLCASAQTMATRRIVKKRRPASRGAIKRLLHPRFRRSHCQPSE